MRQFSVEPFFSPKKKIKDFLKIVSFSCRFWKIPEKGVLLDLLTDSAL